MEGGLQRLVGRQQVVKDAGLTVAAGYAGNEENAKRVAEELGVFIVNGQCR